MYTFSSLLALSLISTHLAAPIDVGAIGTTLANGVSVVKSVTSSTTTIKAVTGTAKSMITSAIPSGIVAAAANALVSSRVTISPPSIAGATVNVNPPAVVAQTIGGLRSAPSASTTSLSKSSTPLISVIYSGVLPQGPGVSASSVLASTKPSITSYSILDTPSISIVKVSSPTIKVFTLSAPTTASILVPLSSAQSTLILTLFSNDKRPVTIISAPSYTVPTAIPSFISASGASLFLSSYTSAPSGAKVTTYSSPSISTLSTDKSFTSVNRPAFSAPAMPTYTPTSNNNTSFSPPSGPLMSYIDARPDSRYATASTPPMPTYTPTSNNTSFSPPSGPFISSPDARLPTVTASSSAPYFNIPASMLTKGTYATAVDGSTFSTPSIPTFTQAASKIFDIIPTSRLSISSPDARLVLAPTPSTVPYFNSPVSMSLKDDYATKVNGLALSRSSIPTYTTSIVPFIPSSSGPSLIPSAPGVQSFSAPSKLLNLLSSPPTFAMSTADKPVTINSPVSSTSAEVVAMATANTASNGTSASSTKGPFESTIATGASVKLITSVLPSSSTVKPSVVTIIRSTTNSLPAATPLVVGGNVQVTAQASKTLTLF